MLHFEYYTFKFRTIFGYIYVTNISSRLFLYSIRIVPFYYKLYEISPNKELQIRL